MVKCFQFMNLITVKIRNFIVYAWHKINYYPFDGMARIYWLEIYIVNVSLVF